MPLTPRIASGQLLLYAIYDVADEADLATIERVVRARSNVGERISRLQLERQRTSVTFAAKAMSASFAAVVMSPATSLIFAEPTL